MARSLRRFEPIEIQSGTDDTITITLNDGLTALGVVGASAAWQLYEGVPRRRFKPFNGLSKLAKTSAAGEITLTTGQAVVAIAPADLDGLVGEYWQVIQITDSSGNVTHQGQGRVIVQAQLPG